MFLIPVRRLWATALNLAGVVFVAIDLVQFSGRDPRLVAVAAWTAWVLWVLVLFQPESWLRVRGVLLFGMIAGGALAGTTAVAYCVPAIVAFLTLAGVPAFPLRLSGIAGGVSAALIGAGLLFYPAHHGDVISTASLMLVSGFGGLSRRQYRVSEAQTRALLEERVTVEQERARVAALAERTRIARDLHDVLAHSLGGLVIQLEAVDALLESGQAGPARDRAQAARKLAVSGLTEAKQAVSALREPDEPLSEVVDALAATHRTLGAQVAVRGDADRGTLDAPGRAAAHRAVQELLTNARRHASGAPTTLDLDWDDDMLTITASTPAGRTGGRGGGHGLAGMRERVGEAGGTMTVREGPPFEVVLRLPGRPG